ncbi:hypothetical protein CANARDRAFT_185435, partial [[Candida] arabinofermentans NRRL YB-2248]
TKRPDRYTTGLINMTTDCFANSTMQALSSLPELNKYLNCIVRIHSNLKKTTNDKVVPKLVLHLALVDLMSKLQEIIFSNRVISVWDFLHVLEKIYNSRISRNQHDAHELLQLILETLLIEYNNLKKVFEKGKDEDDIFPDFPFSSELYSGLRCMRCGKKSSINYNPMMILSLAVPQEISIDLESLLKRSESETIDDYSCLRCMINFILNDVKKRSDFSAEELKYLEELKDGSEKDELLINDDLDSKLEKYIKSYPGIKDPSLKSAVHKQTSIIIPPRILPIHLSRSIFLDTHAWRNSCNVNFGEYLTLKVDSKELEAYKRHEEEKASDKNEKDTKASDEFNEDANSDDDEVVLSNSSDENDPDDDSLEVDDDDENEEEEEEEDDDDEDKAAGGLTSTSTLVNDEKPGFKTYRYKLKAVIRHQGSHQLGHYECYKRKPVFYKNAITGEFYKKFPELTDSRLVRQEGILSAITNNNANGNKVETAKTRRRASSNFSRFRSRVSSLVGGSRPTTLPNGDLNESATSNSSTTISSLNNGSGGKSGVKDKKLASSVKHPFWRISDSKITEFAGLDVLADSKAVYMIFYELVD